MNTSARSPLRIHPALAVAVIVLCLALIVWLFWPIHVLLVEVSALLVMALGFRYWPPMVRWFLGMPVAHRLVFVLVLGCMLAGHFTFDNRKYFPFISWEIFSNAREEDPVTCREFIGLTGEEPGGSRRLLVEQLFPSIIQFNLPADNDSKEMTDLVHALAAEYNGQHPGDRLQRVDLVQLKVRLHPAADESHQPPSCELLKRYDVSSDRSN